MKHHIIYSLIALCATGVIVSAAEPPAYASVIDEITANNPSLAERKASLRGESLGLKADNNLADPEVEFEHQWSAGQVGNKWSVSVNQSFDWPGVYRCRAKAAASRTSALELLYKADVADLKLRVGSLLVDYVAACKKLAVAESIRDNLARIYELMTKSYESGAVVIIDYRKVKFELAKAEDMVAEASTLVGCLRYELIELNGNRPVDLSAVTEFPVAQLQSEAYYIDRHASLDPTIEASEYLVEGASQTLAAASRSSMPGFSLGYIHNVELGDHFNGLRVSMTLPFFSNRHRKAQAAADLETAREQALQASMAVTRRVQSDWLRARKLDDRIARYAELFGEGNGQGADYLTLLQKSFDGGLMPLTVYLYELNYYNSTRTDYIDMLQARSLAALALERYE